MSKWILSLLLIAGIAVGQQKKVVVKKKPIHKDNKEQTVDVDVQTDGDQMTIIVTQDGEENEYTIDFGDQKALKEVKAKLADLDVNIGTMVMDDDNVFKIHSGGYLGVQIQELTDGLRDYFKVKGNDGVLISEVVEDSPAAKAKLKAGDIILSVNGDNVSTTSELQRAISRHNPDSEVEFEIVRKGRSRDITATLGAQNNNFSWTGKMPMMELDKDHDAKFLFIPKDGKIELDGGLFDFHKKAHFDAHNKALNKHLMESSDKLHEHKKYKMRMVGPADSDDLRKELDAMKKELKKLRKEVNKLKKS